jgi:hypothetical protein
MTSKLEKDAHDRVVHGELEFHFEKANFFRVIHVDGAFGGISPANQLIHMSVFSERQPIPKLIVQKVDHGLLGEEVSEKRVVKSGIFREIEADLVMSVDIAIAIRGWLDERITQIQQTREQMIALAKKETKQ